MKKCFLSRIKKASSLDPLTDPIIHNKSLISHSVVNIYSKSWTIYKFNIFMFIEHTKKYSKWKCKTRNWSKNPWKDQRREAFNALTDFFFLRSILCVGKVMFVM